MSLYDWLTGYYTVTVTYAAPTGTLAALEAAATLGEDFWADPDFGRFHLAQVQGSELVVSFSVQQDTTLDTFTDGYAQRKAFELHDRSRAAETGLDRIEVKSVAASGWGSMDVGTPANAILEPFRVIKDTAGEVMKTAQDVVGSVTGLVKDTPIIIFAVAIIIIGYVVYSKRGTL